MDARFEDDLIEVASDGNYLMLCAERQMLFLNGAAKGKVALADITDFGSDGQALVVHTQGGDAYTQPFPSAPVGFAAETAERLNAAADAWR